MLTFIEHLEEYKCVEYKSVACVGIFRIKSRNEVYTKQAHKDLKDGLTDNHFKHWNCDKRRSLRVRRSIQQLLGRRISGQS